MPMENSKTQFHFFNAIHGSSQIFFIHFMPDEKAASGDQSFVVATAPMNKNDVYES